ncbi:CCD62 protein, partial [Nyctibius bracteatus]|nr:CCD62 protein [Nyctibius bracteatus]
TIMKLRQELQLLTAELKDREKEHRDMVAARQAQMLAWEHDWQKILTLEERCRLLSNELNERDEIIKSLAKRLKFLESQQNDSKTTFENRQQEFKELPLKVTDATAHCQALEELRKKSVLREARAEEFSLNKEKQDLKLRLKELILETNKLKGKCFSWAPNLVQTSVIPFHSGNITFCFKDDLYEKMKENNKQQEEIIHLKEENGSLRNELALTVEKAERRDQLLQFAKSKQAQTDTELSSLRQVQPQLCFCSEITKAFFNNIRSAQK